jgi:hypothetical protein
MARHPHIQFKMDGRELHSQIHSLGEVQGLEIKVWVPTTRDGGHSHGPEELPQEHVQKERRKSKKRRRWLPEPGVTLLEMLRGRQKRNLEGRSGGCRRAFQTAIFTARRGRVQIGPYQ